MNITLLENFSFSRTITDDDIVPNTKSILRTKEFIAIDSDSNTVYSIIYDTPISGHELYMDVTVTIGQNCDIIYP